LGGTAGAIPIVLIKRCIGRYDYAFVGFSIMFASQILFVIYMMAVDIF